MLERSSEAENPLMGEEDADSLVRSLEQKKDASEARAACIPSVMCFSIRCQRSLLPVLLLCFWPVTDARTAFRKLQLSPSTDNNFGIVERR
ncbi:hypothetical protein EUGRSUZ_H00837 [Eucalyptus grandis]|uniref:Uncharacterized protein n=2 Tax=Eucalyptus grandis TaxID=71139 RepID=A0ACC3JLZ6_EUCGR|nr:hypothetical protein EUGRSUZ_H00837 [Eucalyptus grandis]